MLESYDGTIEKNKYFGVRAQTHMQYRASNSKPNELEQQQSNNNR